ncbi:RHS repeat domain-containing protein [Flavobacterium sp. LMO6]|uniref:RHS repeat domain-containing protein n=1 Tax=Flavobacterium sp. LMO6 TaxID=2654243 RepID=UPI00351B3E5F
MHNYQSFGMLVPNRHGSSNSYRYGFQGQEKDDELKGEGNSLNYTFRMHDPRVGRFFAIDPLTHKYPHYTPYSFSGNKVIAFRELEGLEEIYAADGKFIGKIGNSTEIRVVHSNQFPEKIKEKIDALNKKEASFLYNYMKDEILNNTYQTFNSADEAAEYFGNKINSKSVIVNKEYGAGINEVQLFNAEGTKVSGKVYLLGKIVEGRERFVSPLDVGNRRDGPFKINALAPEDQSHMIWGPTIYLPGITVALAHSHAQGSLNFSGKNHSPLGGYEGDKAMAEEYSLNVYLVNKIGQLKFYDFKTEKDKTVKENLPGSKNKPIRDENGKPIDYTKENK